MAKYNVINIGGEVLNLDGALDHADAIAMANQIETEHDIDVKVVAARLTEKEAFDLGVQHGSQVAAESGSNDAGCDGWDGMLINADPSFARESFGWDGIDSDEEAKQLLAEYCRGCQSGADATVGS